MTHHLSAVSMGISLDHYLHRIGRCGRQQRGIAITLFVPDFDTQHAESLCQLLDSGRHEISEDLREMRSRTAARNGARVDPFEKQQQQRGKPKRAQDDDDDDAEPGTVQIDADWGERPLIERKKVPASQKHQQKSQSRRGRR